MLFHEQPSGEWTDLDFRILEAYQIMQDELCPQCGHPVWLCRSKKDSITWKVESSICYATRAKEENLWKKTPGNRGAPKREEKAKWGLSTYMKPAVASNCPKGTKLPTREEFYRGR